jgi:hypothetical protein
VHSRVQQLKHEYLKRGIKIAERIAQHMGTRNAGQVLQLLIYSTKHSTLPVLSRTPCEKARNMIRNHPQSGCGCDSFAIFTDATSDETHGFCGDDDSCDGMWGYYFNGYILRFLDPSEYAHILSSSQVARFRDHISAHELILQHPQSGCGCDLTCIDFTGEVHGFCGNDDMCDGVWEYFCGSCLAHLNPREYAHIYSPSQISRISEFFVKKAEVFRKQAAAIQTAHDCACVD